VDIGFAIGSIVRLQIPRAAWRWESSAASSPRARRLTLGSSNLVYFREPTLRTQLHMSVCGPERRLLRDSNTSEIGGKPEVPGAHSKRH
jgi:hypothetical protein